MPTETELIIKARDAISQAEQMRGLYLKGKIEWEVLRPYLKVAEQANVEMRRAVKGGTYRKIEQDLKKKHS